MTTTTFFRGSGGRVEHVVAPPTLGTPALRARFAASERGQDSKVRPTCGSCLRDLREATTA